MEEQKETCQICGEREVELHCPLCGNEMCGDCTSENEEYDCICSDCIDLDYFCK